MKKFAFSAILVAGLIVPSSVDAATFKNCTALNKKYRNGVAKNAAAAKKQKKAPKVSASIYRAHIKLDRDRDGTVCEK